MSSGDKVYNNVVGEIGVLQDKEQRGDKTLLIFQDRSILVNSSDASFFTMNEDVFEEFADNYSEKPINFQYGAHNKAESLGIPKQSLHSAVVNKMKEHGIESPSHVVVAHGYNTTSKKFSDIGSVSVGSYFPGQGLKLSSVHDEKVKGRVGGTVSRSPASEFSNIHDVKVKGASHVLPVSLKDSSGKEHQFHAFVTPHGETLKERHESKFGHMYKQMDMKKESLHPMQHIEKEFEHKLIINPEKAQSRSEGQSVGMQRFTVHSGAEVVNKMTDVPKMKEALTSFKSDHGPSFEKAHMESKGLDTAGKLHYFKHYNQVASGNIELKAINKQTGAEMSRHYGAAHELPLVLSRLKSDVSKFGKDDYHVEAFHHPNIDRMKDESMRSEWTSSMKKNLGKVEGKTAWHPNVNKSQMASTLHNIAPEFGKKDPENLHGEKSLMVPSTERGTGAKKIKSKQIFGLVPALNLPHKEGM